MLDVISSTFRHFQQGGERLSEGAGNTALRAAGFQTQMNKKWKIAAKTGVGYTPGKKK